ncbi:MAG: citramalate synthase [Bacteroidetes bacterium]|nr:citramalate synthase [Bacteroidota bacterium]MCY4204393.1 citramalate synthase [Bacteroidota bacterium]
MERIELFDTTLRDGTQGEHVTLSVNDKVRIAHKLDAFGIDIIEGGWPGSNPKDQEFFERANQSTWQQASICAFGSTRRAQNITSQDPNLLALLNAKTDTVSIFGKSWLLHVKKALNVTSEENLDMIANSIQWLVESHRRVIYDAEHFFDGYKDDAHYALETLQAASEAGANVLVLCDTNGGTMPSEIAQITESVCSVMENHVIGIHAHNDSGVATANTVMAVEAGARHIQGTINGIGERTGNADLCTAIACLQYKLGYRCVSEEQLATLSDLSQFVYEICNMLPIDRAPFVGRSAFAHKGGIHVSAVMKEPCAYEHMDPKIVGNKRRVLVSDLSGQSNVRYKAQELGISLNGREEARNAVQRIKELEHLGYEFQGAEASFELLLRTIQGEDTEMFRLDRLRVHSEQDEKGLEWSEATVAVFVGEHRELAVGEGVGPVDALSRALNQALYHFYPHLENLRLADYKVRVLTPEKATAASVRVLIEHHDTRGEDTWHTVGVSPNILDASWQALTDGVRYYLLRNHSTVKPGQAVAV